MRKLSVLLLFLPIIAWASTTWVVTVTSISQDNRGNTIVGLNFAGNNGQTYAVNDVIPLGAAATQVQDFAAQTISNLNAQEVAFSTATSLGQVIIPTPPVSGTVNLFAVQETQFLNNFQRLRQYQEAINYGLINSSDTTYTALLSSTTNEYAVIKDTVTPLMIAAP